MSGNYIPLYRKYRPQTLENLVGQEHIKKTLTSAIELGKISHAYLFTGPRGTGKTSTARILAKSLNCKNGPTVHPCGECESCRDITNSIPIDVIEIDAASNRKVEDTQNLLEKIQYVPVNGKYKIYIIDEVHMLSAHAFNALLKTLEEPPQNVIFILATTEVHKVLDTIKSRCQRFDFRRITTEDIVKHLRYISTQEKINITDDALYAIAKNSAGGMRDSISLLDQLSIIGISKEITVEDVNAILGRISFDVLYGLSEKIIASESAEAISSLNNIYNSGNEPLQILTNLAEYFKNLLIVKTCSSNLLIELTGLNEQQINDLQKQKERLETQQIVFLIERISHYIKEIKLTTNQYLWLEVSIVDLANMAENTALIDLQNRIAALEAGAPVQDRVLFSPVTKPAPIQPPKTEAAPAEAAPVKSQDALTEDFTPPPISKKPDSNDINVLWQTLLENVHSPSTQALLKLATPVKVNKEGVIITFKNDDLVSRINNSNKKALVVEAADVIFNQKSTHVTIRLAGSSDKTEHVKPVKAVPPKQASSSPKAEILAGEPSPEEQAEDVLNSFSDSDDEAREIGEDGELMPDNTNMVRKETEQEKMVRELFDGKYIE